MAPPQKNRTAGWAKRARVWRAAAIVNAYRGLCLFLLGASPVLARVALATPLRAAVILGGALAVWRNTTVARLLWQKLPIPEVAREAIGADCAHFLALTAKGPIFRACVALLKRVLDLQRPPLTPRGLRATAVRAGSVKLSWEPTVASFFSDETYRLEGALLLRPHAPEPAEGSWKMLYKGPLCAHELRDLEPGTPFAWRVRAVNNKGESALKCGFFATKQLPSAKDGGLAPGYSWAQDVKELTVRLAVPAGVRAADLLATCSATHLRVSLLKKGAGGADKVLLNGLLAKPADPTEFAWQFVEPADGDAREAAAGRIVELTVKKADAMLGRPMWPALIMAYDKGSRAEPHVHADPALSLLLEHPRIDTTLIKTEAPELGDHHLKELHELMKGVPDGYAGGDDE
ncbi:hypothetical protein T492DRAFT_994670 [Pavlovales sp. CCMP2436]|nr:hypothetical protein T492DRAFT_994670 [Pavlovales sp. CCMP2436]|mmetsp:Transcript_22707/g.53741  ORF Transcript_22707/g.53741 Transcript_22707/m.53741 type:complete len:403 (+) Transcript_22707:278-1486(+)